MISLHITESLKHVLNQNNLTESDYSPAYGGESAGLDLYTTQTITVPGISIDTYRVPLNNDTYDHNHDVWPHSRTLIPTGLKVAIPRTHVGLIQERGSVSKTPLKLRAGVIDSGYSGEIFINVVSVREDFTLQAGEKTPFQIIFVPICNTYKLVDENEFNEIHSSSQRQSGMIGSSDTKLPASK